MNDAAFLIGGRFHLRRDLFYGSAFLLIGAAFTSWALRGGWFIPFAWPAVSFAIVGVAYLVGDASLFGKRSDGSRHWVYMAALLPYLLFARVVWLAQVTLSSEPATSSVNERLTVSRRLRPQELPPDTVQICDLTCEFVDPKAFRSRCAYICHPILDAGTTDAAELLDFARSLQPSAKGRLLVHCANGHGRTGMFAAVWLLAHGFATSADEAIELIQAVRPGVSLRRRQFQLVRDVGSLLPRSGDPSNTSSAPLASGAADKTRMPPPK